MDDDGEILSRTKTWVGKIFRQHGIDVVYRDALTEHDTENDTLCHISILKEDGKSDQSLSQRIFDPPFRGTNPSHVNIYVACSCTNVGITTWYCY